MPYQHDFQIGTSVAGLAVLPRWGIGWPDEYPYQPWSRQEIRGDGHGAGFGFPMVVWEYDHMGQAMLWRYLNFLDSEDDASVALYIRTYKDWHVRLNPANFKCIFHRPIDGSGKQLHARVHPMRAAYSGVSISFTHLEEQ